MASTWDETLCVPREAANRDLVIAEMDQKRFTQYPILEAEFHAPGAFNLQFGMPNQSGFQCCLPHVDFMGFMDLMLLFWKPKDSQNSVGAPFLFRPKIFL